jgi:mRNA interferase HigB
VRIVAKRSLRAFWEMHPEAEQPLLAWYREVEKEDWDSPAKIKAKYRAASIVGGNRVVFNIKGNDYRLVAKINYPHRVVYIRFVGTHADYDAIDVEEV